MTKFVTLKYSHDNDIHEFISDQIEFPDAEWADMSEREKEDLAFECATSKLNVWWEEEPSQP